MLIPLVVVPDCQEHYENVKDMRELVDVNTVECVSESSDIKMLTVGDLRRAHER